MRRPFWACVATGVLLLASSAAAEEPLVYRKGVIDRDTAWQGTVLIEGQTVVKRGTTLTILPGTTVKFLWTDEDGDGIGDGELNCEGRIVARGTKDNPILFTSARESPKPKDWTFIMISQNKDALVEYCTIEYAFSGIQVHYSTGAIRNNLIRRNYEGIRFSTTNVLIEYNDIVDNEQGIHHESRGSKTTITRNTFRGNGCSFFPVQKSSATVRVFENNFDDSCVVKMGFNQTEDLDYSNNWWGTTDREKIQAMIFDRRTDPALGTAKFEPFLDTPVKPCGIQ